MSAERSNRVRDIIRRDPADLTTDDVYTAIRVAERRRDRAVDDILLLQAKFVEVAQSKVTVRNVTGCQAGKDGDCIWNLCPQVRDNEPSRSGRHCPLDFAQGTIT